MVRVVCLFLKGVDTPLLFLSPFAGPSPISRCNLHATSRSSHSRRSPSFRFLLCRVVLVCLVLRRRRRLPLPCSRGFLRLSAQLCPPGGIFWPLEFIELSSRKDDSSEERKKERKQTTQRRDGRLLKERKKTDNPREGWETLLTPMRGRKFFPGGRLAATSQTVAFRVLGGLAARWPRRLLIGCFAAHQNSARASRASLLAPGRVASLVCEPNYGCTGEGDAAS